MKNRTLEDAVHEKDQEITRLKDMNEQLEAELCRIGKVRMSQLEALAIRNVQLEKELGRCNSNGDQSVTNL